MALFGLGAFLAAAVVIPLFIGLAVDAVAHTSPVGLLVGLVAGITAACAGLWAQLRRYL
jgi:F0F1-type ATP synthase assembly protein I